MLSLCLIILALIIPSILSDTIISTFTDSNCLDSFNSIQVPDGYPNGTCTELGFGTSTTGSFQIISVDEGCVVTLYEPNSDNYNCSGAAMVARPFVCYSSPLQFASADNCVIPSPSISPGSSQTTTVKSQLPLQQSSSTTSVFGQSATLVIQIQSTTSASLTSTQLLSSTVSMVPTTFASLFSSISSLSLLSSSTSSFSSLPISSAVDTSTDSDSAPTQSPHSSSNPASSLPESVTIGIAVGVVIGFILLVAVIWFCWLKAWWKNRSRGFDTMPARRR